MGKQKNLLYIFADQWRAHAVGAAGEDPVATLNRLCAALDCQPADLMEFLPDPPEE